MKKTNKPSKASKRISGLLLEFNSCSNEELLTTVYNQFASQISSILKKDGSLSDYKFYPMITVTPGSTINSEEFLKLVDKVCTQKVYWANTPFYSTRKSVGKTPPQQVTHIQFGYDAYEGLPSLYVNEEWDSPLDISIDFEGTEKQRKAYFKEYIKNVVRIFKAIV